MWRCYSWPDYYTEGAIKWERRVNTYFTPRPGGCRNCILHIGNTCHSLSTRAEYHTGGQEIDCRVIWNSSASKASTLTYERGNPSAYLVFSWLMRYTTVPKHAPFCSRPDQAISSRNINLSRNFKNPYGDQFVSGNALYVFPLSEAGLPRYL